jgi:1-acyl-sn-glycerol-3-phosphate acyltransferase
MPGSAIDRVLRRAGAPVAGTARMMQAVMGDLAGAVGGGNGKAELIDARDPDYIEATLPTIEAWCRLYFRGEVTGLENIPDGPVLLVGNHSGGTLIADTFVFTSAFYRHFGARRRFHQLAHDLVFTVPGMRALVIRYGTIPASPKNMRRALERDAALLVYPGGDHETYRPSWESDEIDFGGRTGFVKLALELGTPIVPVVAIGGQETALFLGQGRGIARRMQLDRLMRLKVFPAQIGPPFGLTVLDLPLRFPLPAKITVEVLPPIDLRERLGGEADVEEAYELVTATMQEALTRLAEERTLPVVG